MAITYDEAKGGYTDGATTWSPNSDGTIGVDEAGYVAAIGDTRYTSFENAQAAVKPGETITILTDVDAENISMNGYGLASWNNSKLTATGNIIATTGNNVLSGNVGSAQLMLTGSKDEDRTLTITESANVDLYIKGRLDDGLLDIGKGLSDEVTTADSGERVYFAHAKIAGDVSVKKYKSDGNAESGAVYIRPYSELVVTGKLDVVGEVHNRGSLVVDGGTMKMSKWLTPKLLGYDTGDSMTVTNKGTMTVSGASAVTFGEASASLQHMDVVAQYADGMFATISAGGQFVADTLAFANDNDVTLTVTGEGSLFKLYTDGRTELSYYTYVQNEGKIIIADNAVFDVSELANDNFVNTGTIDISSATATFATLTNDGTVNFKGGTEFSNTLTGSGTVVYTGEGNRITGGSVSNTKFIVGLENPDAVPTSLEISGGAAVEVTGGGNCGRFAPESDVVITGDGTTFTVYANLTMDESATLAISDGATVNIGYLATGGKTDVTGATLNLTGSVPGKPASAGASAIGGLDDATVFNVSDGGVVNAQAGLVIGHRETKDAEVNVNAGGELNVSGGALYVSGLVGNYTTKGNGVLNIDGGKVTASNGGDFGLYVGDDWGGASGVLNVTNGGSLTAGFSVQFYATSVVTVDGGEITVNQLYQSEGGKLSIVNGGSVTLTNSYFGMGGEITVGGDDSGAVSTFESAALVGAEAASLGGDYGEHEGETVLNILENGEAIFGSGLKVGHRADASVSKDATVNVEEGGRMEVAKTLQIGSVGDAEAVGVVNVTGGELDASTADVGLNSKSSLNITNGSFSAQSVTNNGAINVTGEAVVDAEFAATKTGAFSITDATLGQGTNIQFGAMNVDELLPAVTLKGTVTVTDGAYLNTGREGNLTMGFGTGDSGTLNISDGAQVSLGGALYFGSEEALADDGMFYLNISGEGSRLQSDGYNGEFYITGDAVVTVSNGGTIANNARVRSGATYIFGSVDDTVAANVSFRSMELVEQANVTIQGGAVADLGILVFGDQDMAYDGSFTLAADSLLKIDSYSAFSGEAEITVSGMDDTFSGVWKLIDNTGSNTLDYSAMISNWNDISGSVAVVENDLYRVNVDMTTLKVNSTWSGSEIGTEVEEGFYYGFNAFDGINTAVVGIADDTTTISIAAGDYAGSADAEFTQGMAIASDGAIFDNMWSFGVNSDTAAEFNPETAEKFTVSGELTVGQFYAEKNANVYVVIDGDLTTVGSFGAKLATQLDINGSVTVTPPENGAAQVMVYGTMNVTGTLDSTSGPMAAVMLIGNDRYDTEYGKGGVLNVTGDNASVTLRGNTDSDMPVLISGLSSLNLSDGATFTHENGSIENKGTINVASSTLTVGVALENSGTVNVSGTSMVAATIDGAVNLLDDTDVTFKGGAKDLLVESGAEVTLRGELSGNEVVYEKGYKYNAGGAQGITVNIASGEGTTFQSYAWYASNGSIYNVKTGSTAEITYANINATGTINVDEGATLTAGRESSNILGTLNVNGTLNSVMTVYAGYADGAQAGLVNITGTANSSIVTIGTAVRDDDKYNAAAAEGANTTASIVVNGGTFNVTGQEGELTSKLFVGSTDYAGTLSAVNGTINVGARSADGTGYMRFLIGEKGALNLDNSTLTVYNLGGTNNSGEGVFQNSGAINMDVDSQIVTATALENSGTITVDMTGAAEFGVYKLIDYTGTGSGSITDYGSIQLSNNNYFTRIIDNDLYLVRADGAKELYVNSAWQSAAAYKEVTFVDGTKAYYGLNAFDTVDNAVKSLPADDPIRLNVTGDIGAITVVGKDVTEVNASAKDQIDPETGTVAADAIVVNLVDINNTNAGWQVYYPLASGSNAQVYGNITTKFLSTTFTYEGERTGDPNFSGAGYAGTTATVYGNTTVNIGEVDADDSKLTLNTSFLLGAGGGTVNGSSSLNINSGTIAVDAIVGGGAWRGQVKGDSSVTISGGVVSVDTDPESTGRAIFGGSYGNVNYNPDNPDAPSATGGNASVIINGDAQVTGKIIGGSEGTNVKNSLVDISGEAQVTGNVFGGGNRGGQVEETSTVNLAGTATVNGNVYGGGFGTADKDSSVATAAVTISGGTVTGDVYAGGYLADVTGDAVVTLSGGTVGGDIYGGSEGSGTVAGSSTLNVGATDAARYTTTLNNVYDFDVANITNAAVTVEDVFSATQISIADSTLTLNSGFDAATTTVSIEVGAYNAENAALVLGSAVGTAPAISVSAGSNALTEARYLVATGFDDTTAFSLDESLAGDYLLRAVDGNIYLYNADAPYFTTELSVTQAEGASVDGYYSFTANFEAAGLLTGYTLKLYDSATATTPVDEVTLDADVIGQEFTLENTTQSFWISVTANGENGLSTDSPTSGRLEVVVKDYDSPVIQSVSSNVASDAITLTCEATDNFGVTGYEFILDGQSLGVQTGSEIALDLSTLTAGTHSYTVNVYDAAGNLATSAEQSFDFTPAPVPTEPANFLYSSQVRINNGETVTVYANYSNTAAVLEYRIGDTGEWLTYDATTGVNVSSSTTVYFREQGITDPVETAVDVTVVPADVELNAEVILLAPTTDTTYEVIYNFADGGSKAVELSGNSVEHYALPEDTKITIVEKDASGEVVNTIVEETPAASTTAEIPDKVVAVDDGHDNLFFAMPVGTWDGSFSAQHLGDGTWGGTQEIVSLTGKNRFSTVFTGSDDATTLFLTDDANGDAFFLDDVYTANGSDARIRKMSEIQAGAGDDIVDLTSTRFAYEEHASKQLTVRGGDGNDILWGNAGHNIMFGDAGNDKIYGGSDDDVLVGGIGNDTMHGGGGDDIFCYSNSFDWGSDTITQLAGGTVTLYLDGIDRNDCSISGSTLTWNDGTHTGSITLNGVSWDSVKFYCAANGDGDLTKQSDYEELKNKGVFAAISSH
ncbi:Ig-like domain-containing protein [Victivallis sp.]|uniref:Ig-like domain-containing protein n=1 Tax=Victivallis sp. TaxID=2049020 RepID=UPI003A95ADEA